jgi:ribosomal protein S18 acetylase RimI-like enzyme
MGGKWTTGAISDKESLLAFLETDRLYAAYAIGDLEPELYAQCSWAGAQQDGRIRALGLHFRGLDPAACFLMGDPEGVRLILRDAPHPERVFLTCRAEHLGAVEEAYAWEGAPHLMWRMALRRRDIPSGKKICVRMTAGHTGQIRQLVAHGGAIGFAAAQIQQGVFFGIFEDEILVSLAGTHLVGPAYGVAGVGNVVTHPQHRGRGYGQAAVAAVVKELVQLGIRDIVLNVRHDNAPALHLYEALGFERYCAFLEGPASSRETGTPLHAFSN